MPYDVPRLGAACCREGGESGGTRADRPLVVSSSRHEHRILRRSRLVLAARARDLGVEDVSRPHAGSLVFLLGSLVPCRDLIGGCAEPEGRRARTMPRRTTASAPRPSAAP